MWVDNLPANLLKAALKIVEAAEGQRPPFQKGDIVEGSIIKNLPGNQALVRLGGVELIALAEAKLRPGQIIVGRVEQVSPAVTISLLKATGGKDQKVAGMIRLLIPGKAPMGDLLSKAFNLEGQLRAPPKAQEAVSQLTEVNAKISSLSLDNISAEQVKQTVKQSGLFLESMLKQAVSGKLSKPQIAALIKGDIKAELGAAFNKLESEIARLSKEMETVIKTPAEDRPDKGEPKPTARKNAGAQVSLSAGAKKQVAKQAVARDVETKMAELVKLRETAKEIKNALNNIELNQLLNSSQTRDRGAGQTNFNLYQIPFMQGAILETARIYIKPQGEGRGSPGRKKSDESSIVFMLNMSKLGPVRVDVNVGSKKVTGSVYVLNDTVANFIRDNLPQLAGPLEAAGYNVWFEVATADRKRITEELENFTPITRKGLINVKA